MSASDDSDEAVAYAYATMNSLLAESLRAKKNTTLYDMPDPSKVAEQLRLVYSALLSRSGKIPSVHSFHPTFHGLAFWVHSTYEGTHTVFDPPERQ